MSLNVALVFSGDSTGAKNAAQQTVAAVRETGAASAQAAAAITAANDQAVVSAERVIRALTGEAAAQKQVWQAAQAMVARGTPTDDATYRQRGADINAYGAALDQLRARYNPLFAAEQAHIKNLAEMDRALKVGAISETEHADAVRQAASAYELQRAGLDEVAGSALAAKLQLEEYSRMAVAAREQQANDQAQVRVNQLLGVRDPSAMAGSARNSASAFDAMPMELTGAELDQLRAKYNALFAVELAHAQNLDEIDRALEVGALSEREHADAVRQAASAYELQRAGLDAVAGSALAAKLQLEEYSRMALVAREQQASDQAQLRVNNFLGVRDPSAMAGSARASADAFLAFPDAKEGAKNVALASHEMTNLTYQMNDIVMMLASGQSPFMMMMQQGSQVTQIMGQRGLGQILPAIGGALRNLISPTTMLLAGVTAAGYAAYTAYRLVVPEVRSLDDILDRHKDLVDRLKQSYSDATDEAKRYSRESQLVLRSQAGAENDELTKRLQDEARKIFSAQSLDAYYRGVDLGPLAGPLEQLNDEAKDGVPNFQAFQIALTRIAEDTTFSDGVRKKAKELRDFVNEFVRGQTEAKRFETEQEMVLRGLRASQDMDAYSKYKAAQEVEAKRAQGTFDAQRRSLYARSPDELASVARETEAAQHPADESARERNRRINMAGQMAYLQAQHQLDEAQKERKRSLDALLGSQQLDLNLIGKTAGEAAQMRLQFQLTQELREEAARNNTKVDQDELNRIIAKAKAYGEYADQISRANLASDIAFEREQILRSDDDREITQRLRGAGLPVDLDGYMAGLMRSNMLLERQKQEWENIRDVGRDAIDQLLDVSSWDDFEQAGKQVLNNLLNEMLKLSIGNPLKNAIYGDNQPTLQSMGGFGGVLGALFGAPFGGDDKQVGSMTVSAGNVVVTGAIGAGGSLGGLMGNVSRLLTGANDNSAGGVGDLLGRARSAIASIESGGSGGYSALGPKLANGNQALGAYQVMSNNLPSWSQAALGKTLSPEQFLASPASQDKVFDHFFGKSLEKYGNAQDAASVWFTGRPQSGGSGSIDVLGTTGAAYVDKFNTAMGRLDDTTTAATKNLGQFGTGLGNLGQNLSAVFPAAPSAGGGIGGLLGSLFGGSGGSGGGNAGLSPAAWAAIQGGGGGLYADGGWTGPGGKFEPRGIVHADEYVFSKDATRAIGVTNLDRLHSAAQRGFASGGSAGSGSFSSGPSMFAPVGGGRTVVEIRLSEGLVGELMQQSGEQTVQIIQMTDRNREELYRVGGER